MERVQVKRAGANNDDDVYKMQNRLHFVKCAHCEKFSEHSNFCTKCTTDMEGLKDIYYNSVNLLISLDEKGTYKSFTKRTSQNLQSKTKEDLATLTAALKPNFNFNADSIQVMGKSESFLKPLLQSVEPIAKDVALIKSIWIDKQVQEQPENFIDDKLIHRQFCISTRGWSVFNRLFREPEKSFDIANEILSREGLFKDSEKRNSPQIIRNVLYASSPNYLQYTDELWKSRKNFESYLDKLDKFEYDTGLLQKSIQNLEIESENESESERMQTPPQSPMKPGKR